MFGLGTSSANEKQIDEFINLRVVHILLHHFFATFNPPPSPCHHIYTCLLCANYTSVTIWKPPPSPSVITRYVNDPFQEILHTKVGIDTVLKHDHSLSNLTMDAGQNPHRYHYELVVPTVSSQTTE